MSSSDPATILAVELDGGAMRCPAYPDQGRGGDGGGLLPVDAEDAPTASEQLGIGLAPCVRS